MTLLALLHTPYGLEHPYEQLPEERFPRQPLAGQPFTAGVVTRPVGAAVEVNVHSELNGVPQPIFAAERVPEWRPELEHGVGAEYLERIVRIEQNVWQAGLIAPAHGQTLTYWFEADGITTERFMLIGEQWVAGGGITTSEDRTLSLRRDATSLESAALVAPLPGICRVEWLTDGTRARRVRLSVKCSPEDGFYGLGERFNALNQRGEIMDVRCYEQYKNQGKRTYMPIPFLLVWSAADARGYGLHVESARWMQFDLAAAQPDCWTLEADLGADETLKLILYQGDDPYAIVGQFAQATGPVALPPQWAFGLWLSSNEWNSQARVLHEVEQTLAHGIPATVLVIEAWSDETTFYIWNDAQYTPQPGDHIPRYSDFTFPAEGKWPDPKAMVDYLHAHDIKLLLWQIPALKANPEPHPQHDADRQYYEGAGFGVREADGSLHKIRPFWFRGGAIWDVTNPAEREWWLNKRAYLLDEVGIDGFKTDGGEHLWGESVVFHDGRTGAELWNAYPQLYAQAYYDFANQKREAGREAGREAITFSRAGFTGSQRAPLHWAGDENSTWEAFRHSILAGLSAGISGIPFWGWDIGGFSGDIPTAELYLRATAMAAFCPVMQVHSEYNAHRQPSNDRTPWNMQARTGDARVIPAFKHFVDTRLRLMPYLWREAQFAAASGQPLMQAAKLIHPAASDYDYCFGRDLLVSPVVEPGVTQWTVNLPPGDWRDFWTDTAYQGGQAVTLDAPLDRIPVFMRAGAVVPTG
ncbi:MAG: glycoside hydrolase family 31 protein [bacterium]|nr:glycoside hydrolase family 31 protein [bacterium]